MAKVGQKAPAFNAPIVYSDGRFDTVNLESLRGKWVVLYFYPKDFTFVCPTEIVAFDSRFDDFQDRDAVLLGASTDTTHTHLGWMRSRPDDLAKLRHGLIGDASKRVTEAYDLLTGDDQVALRGTFIIDTEGVLRWASINDLDVGRNVDEVLRVLDALQTGELCPCNWKAGERTLQPA